MEESTGSTASNRTLTIALAVIVIALAAVIAYLVMGGSDSETPGGVAAESTGTANAVTETTPTMPGATEAEFDPKTATKVAQGMTPEKHVSTYFDAVLAGDYEKAYAMLPRDKQESYGSVESFGEQLAAYGMTEYKIESVVEEGDETQVTATAVMPGGSFQYLWTFVKDGDGWLVKSRTLPGMGG